MIGLMSRVPRQMTLERWDHRIQVRDRNPRFASRAVRERGTENKPYPFRRGTAQNYEKDYWARRWTLLRKSVSTRTWSWSQPSCWGSWRALERSLPQARGSHARPVWVQGWRSGQARVWLEREPHFLGFSLHSLQGTILSFLLILRQASPVLQFGFHPPAGRVTTFN